MWTDANDWSNPLINLHEAVGEESEQPDQTIVREVQAGFTLHSKVIRHAKSFQSGANKTASTNLFTDSYLLVSIITTTNQYINK